MGSKVTVVVFALMTSMNALAGEVVLRLSHQVSPFARFSASTIEFTTCEVDPNREAAVCPMSVSVDGKEVKVPRSVLSRLNELRRSFSYDSLSGGIKMHPAERACRIARDPEGLLLEAAYLTYKNFEVVSHEMRVVKTQALNCFSGEVTPVNPGAREDAISVIAILHTLLQQNQ